MKKLLACLLLVFSFSFSTPILVPQTVGAVDIFTTCGNGSAAGDPVACKDANKGQDSAVDPVIVAIRIGIQIMAVVIGIAAVIGIIVSGIRISIAHGDSSAVASARQALIYSLIGLGIAALAQTIVIITIGFVS